MCVSCRQFELEFTHDLQVRLGTVDIFQGQEAKIVIVSLVRNSGEFETDNASIGFLKVTIAQ